MAEFADRMKSFTDHLSDSIRARGEALSRVHASTAELLDGARTFLGHVAEEHRARSEELHATLTSHREGRRQQVAEMRRSHQDSLRTMREDLHHGLSEARRTRQDATDTMFQAFRHARHGLAADLRAASDAWRTFAASR